MSFNDTPTTPVPFRTLDDIRRANTARGHYFFDAGAVRFFGSRFGRTVFGGHLFVTTENDHTGGDRRATIRLALPDGQVETLAGTFRAFPDARAAGRVARSLAPFAPALVALHAAAVASGDGRTFAAVDNLTALLVSGWRPAASDLSAVAVAPVLVFLADRLAEGVAMFDAFAVSVRVASLAVAPSGAVAV